MSGPPIPQGWVFQALAGAGSAATIVVPAGGLNVQHKLTHIDATLTDIGGVATFAALVQVLDGVLVVFQYQLVVNAGGTIDRDSIDIDLARIGSASTSMTLRFSTVATATVVEQLVMTGMDV